MEGIFVNIGERKIPLRFRMNQFIEIEEQVGYCGEIKELILEGKERLRHLITVIKILGNAGLKAAGEPADLTEEWLKENMEPHALLAYQLAVIACMSKETESQAKKEEAENKERDLVLEEIEGKKEPVNLHTGA